MPEQRVKLAPIGSDGVRREAFGTLEAPIRLVPSRSRFCVLCDCGLNDDAGKIQLEFDWNGPHVLNV